MTNARIKEEVSYILTPIVESDDSAASLSLDVGTAAAATEFSEKKLALQSQVDCFFAFGATAATVTPAADNRIPLAANEVKNVRLVAGTNHAKITIVRQDAGNFSNTGPEHVYIWQDAEG